MKLSNNLYLKKYSSNFKIKLEECYDIKKIVLLKNLFEDIKKRKRKL